MTREEIMALDLEQVEARAQELTSEIESAESMDAINEEITALEERKAQIAVEIEERKKDIEAVVQSTVEPVETFEERNEEIMEVRNTPEYIDAYAEYVKSGDPKECRTLLTENVSGTVAVPEFVYDIVKTAWQREGIMSLVRKSYLRGNLKVSFEISGSDATLHTEAANSAVSEEELVLGVVTLTPISIKKWIGISDEVYDMRGEAFLRYIYDELTYRIAKKAADTLIAKIEACVSASTTTCPGVPILSANAAIGNVAAAMAMLSDEAANPVVMMNKATWGTFKALQYSGNFDIDPFEGLPVVFNNTIAAYSAATTGVTYAIVGDLGQGAIANFPNGEGIDIKFDDLTKMEYDIIRILGREYVALGVVAPDAFVKMQKV